MLILLPLFTFLYAFMRNGSANKKVRNLAQHNCDNNLNVSEISFIRPIGLFQKNVVKIEIKSETNYSNECFFEAKLEFRQFFNSLQILRLGIITIDRKLLKAKKQIRVEFECWHFVGPGLYRISLLSNFVASSSEWIQFNPPTNLAIQLRLPAITAIFPFCQNALTISWTLPNCDKVSQLLDFRLRLLAVLNEPNENEEILYLEEFLLAVPNSDANFRQKRFTGSFQRTVPTNLLRISCTKFDIIHEQFCFELVSVSKQYQQHQLWDRKCLRTEAIMAQTKDEHWEWSEWSEWTKCPCRRNGSRKRTRHCRRSSTNLTERTTIGSLSKSKAKAAFGAKGECRGGQIMQKEKCRQQRECRQSGDLALPSLGIGQSVPNLTSDANGTFQCFCGCKLPENTQGMFFASLCSRKNAQRWQLEFGRPFRVQIILSSRLTEEDEDHHQLLWAFEVIRDNGKEKEIIWHWQNNRRDENAIIEGTFEKAAIFELKSANSRDQTEFGRHRKQRKQTNFGILVEYKVIAFEEFSSDNLFTELWSAKSKIPFVKSFCATEADFAQCSILLGLFSLFIFLFAIFGPPFFFVCFIKRHTKKRMAKQFGHICQNGVGPTNFVGNNSSALLVSTHCHNQIDSELMRSDGTDSTKLSNSLLICRKSTVVEAHQMMGRNGVTTVEQRSIGIQLSRHSTPRCASRQFRPRKRRRTSADNSDGSIESETIEENSNLAEDYWNEDDDFDAEQLQLGGRMANKLENSPSHLVSDIDIEQIVRRETSNNKWHWQNSKPLLAITTGQRDASTQHHLNFEMTKQ